MSGRWLSPSSAANGFPCDFCDGFPVGWIRVRLPDRSLGGTRAVEVYMVCAAHLQLGEPVYPDNTPGVYRPDGSLVPWAEILNAATIGADDLAVVDALRAAGCAQVRGVDFVGVHYVLPALRAVDPAILRRSLGIVT